MASVAYKEGYFVFSNQKHQIMNEVDENDVESKGKIETSPNKKVATEIVENKEVVLLIGKIDESYLGSTITIKGK